MLFVPLTIVQACDVVVDAEPPKPRLPVLQTYGPALTVTLKLTVAVLPAGSDVCPVLSVTPFGATQAWPSWPPSIFMVVKSIHWMFVTFAGSVNTQVAPLLFE